jgi:hypothetical protein
VLSVAFCLRSYSFTEDCYCLKEAVGLCVLRWEVMASLGFPPKADSSKAGCLALFQESARYQAWARRCRAWVLRSSA